MIDARPATPSFLSRTALPAAFLVAALWLPNPARAAEIRIPLPEGFALASPDSVATHRDRQALVLSGGGLKTGSRLMQVGAAGPVFTDLAGRADSPEYSADGTHVLIREALPAADPRSAAGYAVYSLIDHAGDVVWSTPSQAAYRIAAGGSVLYVAQFPGETPHIRVFDLRGNLLPAVVPPRPYLDARVLDDGSEALVLFSAAGSRDAADVSGRQVALSRVRLEPDMPALWSVALDPDLLRYPELVPVDRDWVLVTTQEGFVAVSRDGAALRYGSPERTLDAGGARAELDFLRLAPGAEDGTLILHAPGRTLSLNLGSGALVELQASPESRFEDVGYRGRHEVVAGAGEVVLRPLAGRPAARPVSAGREGAREGSVPGRSQKR